MKKFKFVTFVVFIGLIMYNFSSSKIEEIDSMVSLLDISKISYASGPEGDCSGSEVSYDNVGGFDFMFWDFWCNPGGSIGVCWDGGYQSFINNGGGWQQLEFYSGTINYCYL